MTQGKITIEIPRTPPSLNENAGGHAKGKASFAKAKKDWQRELEQELMAAGANLPRGCAMVEVTAALRFGTKRPRDEGNFRALLEKALGDALVNGRWLIDDTADRFRFPRLEIEEEKGKARTTLELTWTRA